MMDGEAKGPPNGRAMSDEEIDEEIRIARTTTPKQRLERAIAGR